MLQDYVRKNWKLLVLRQQRGALALLFSDKDGQRWGRIFSYPYYKGFSAEYKMKSEHISHIFLLYLADAGTIMLQKAARTPRGIHYGRTVPWIEANALSPAWQKGGIHVYLTGWRLLIISHNQVIKFPHSRGVSGALYLQSATAGVMPIWGLYPVELPSISGVDVWVLRNRNLWTVSGQECSSTKQKLLCAVRLPGRS